MWGAIHGSLAAQPSQYALQRTAEIWQRTATAPKEKFGALSIRLVRVFGEPWLDLGPQRDEGLSNSIRDTLPRQGPSLTFSPTTSLSSKVYLQSHCERYLEINLSRRPHSPSSQSQPVIRCPAAPARIPTLFLPRQLFQPICAANFTTTTPRRQRPTT